MNQDDLVAEPSSAALGRTIKALRAQRGMDRKEFAELAGLSYSYLSEIENGKKKPAENIQHAIAKSLKYEVADLLRAAVKLDEQVEAPEEDPDTAQDKVHAFAAPQNPFEAAPEATARVAPAQVDLSETPSVELAELQEMTYRVRIVARDLKAYGQNNDLVEPTKLQSLITDAAAELTKLADWATSSLGQLMLKNLEQAQARAEAASPGDETPLRAIERLEEMMHDVRKDMANFSARQK